MVLLKHLKIHTGPVIISFCKTFADNLHQIGISRIILRQKHQMIIPVLPACQLPVKPGMRRHIDLAADDRIDAFRFRRLIEINDAVHHTVVGDGRTVHAQLFYPLYILFDFIGTVQKTELRVDMQMCKSHDDILPERPYNRPVCVFLPSHLL